MKILLTGATGYIGKRLLLHLLQEGHDVVCAVRDKQRFTPPTDYIKQCSVVECDLLDSKSLKNIPDDIDGSYYLVHSMSVSDNYEILEKQSAQNFREYISEQTNCKQVIYLSGIVNENQLSKHLGSRLEVEKELAKGTYALTTLRAGIIIGSGSASFEIIRDLVEKLPVMITPIWLKTRCQPIAVRDVLKFLVGVLYNERCFNESFDIGGPDILSYQEMLLQFANVRGLTRRIYVVPVMTPKLSSYWLYFVTSTSYKLASALVSSMKVEVVCRNNKLAKILNINVLSYQKALELALAKIENHQIESSWKDSFVSTRPDISLGAFIQVPTHGCFIDKREYTTSSESMAKDKIWKIGGETGWYYGNFLWRIRGFMDKLVGGVGLRRGRTNKDTINNGDALDFWRVLYANKTEGRLLLFAEMKLPGDAWLEFIVENQKVTQTATFRPKGLAGRLYWFAVLPFHGLIFKNMLKKIAKTK